MSTKPGDWWDESLNPWQGCTPISEACEHCWALASLKHWHGQEPGEIRYFLERTEKIVGRGRKRRHVFVGSLTDIFHEQVPDKIIIDFMNILAWPYYGITHKYYLLTKRPWRLAALWQNNRAKDVTEIPTFIRIGITIENQPRLDERLSFLTQIPAAFKFLSIEPLLGPIDLTPVLPHVQWVVVGGETGPKARPMHPEWVRAIRDQCVNARVAFWFKSWGEWLPRICLNTMPIVIAGSTLGHQLTQESTERVRDKKWGILDIVGKYQPYTAPWNGRELNPNDNYECTVYKIGHKESGRILDGRTWEERP